MLYFGRRTSDTHGHESSAGNTGGGSSLDQYEVGLGWLSPPRVRWPARMRPVWNEPFLLSSTLTGGSLASDGAKEAPGPGH